MQSVCALVLTYNRKNLVRKTIKALARQSKPVSKIIVVNNASTDGTPQVLQELQRSFKPGLISIYNLKENLGASGGFSEGMRYFLKHTRADWLWLMDDDAIPERKALEKFMLYYQGLSVQKREQIGILQNERVLSLEELHKRATSPTRLHGKKLMRATFEGYLVKRQVIEKVGFPRSEFFIYSDDIEYSWRVLRAGYEIHRVCGCFIYHRDWAKLTRLRRGLVSKPDIPPWKLYYRFRNPFLIFEGSLFLRYILRIILSIDLYLWAYIKKENAYFARRGIEDGFNLISGRVIQPGSLPPTDLSDIKITKDKRLVPGGN